MAVVGTTYELDDVTPVAIPLYGAASGRGNVAIIQHSGHTGQYDVILGGSNMNPSADLYGHRLAAGESLVIPIWFTSTDTVYAMCSAASGEVHVLIIGA